MQPRSLDPPQPRLGCGKRVSGHGAFVARRMVTLLLAGEMKLPIGIEIARRAYGSEPKDGLGAGERPARAGAVHPVLPHVATRARDDARRDREAVAERLRVVHQARPGAVSEVVARPRDHREGRLAPFATARPPVNRLESFPVEWRAPGGAEVNIDVAHENEGPGVPHVGYQTAGKGAARVRGHILLDGVPVNR